MTQRERSSWNVSHRNNILKWVTSHMVFVQSLNVYLYGGESEILEKIICCIMGYQWWEMITIEVVNRDRHMDSMFTYVSIVYHIHKNIAQLFIALIVYVCMHPLRKN